MAGPDFRRVLVLVARQNGKTYVCTLLAAFWMTVFDPMFILGTSTKTSVAKEPWQATINVIRGALDPEVAAMIPRVGGVRRAAGEEELTLINGSRYKVSAANEDGGRGLPLRRVICDELRSHHDYSAYSASYYAMRARRDAQFWALSSMGDLRSVVLNDMRTEAITFIETGVGDARLFLAEWSPPANARPDDPAALAMANPNAGRYFDIQDLVDEGQGAVAKGGEALVSFKTEAMNICVDNQDPAIDPQGWADGYLVGDLAQLRAGVCWCVDVSMDMRHATLVAAALMPDGRVRVEPVKRWHGERAVSELKRDLPGMVRRNRPRKLGWFPGGPAAAAADALADRKGRTVWPPRGVVVEEIRGEVKAACMAFAANVLGRRVVHSGDPLLDAQVRSAGKLEEGDAWRFTRRGDSYVDAVYGAAGADLLARTLPTPRGTIRVVVPGAARRSPRSP